MKILCPYCEAKTEVPHCVIANAERYTGHQSFTSLCCQRKITVDTVVSYRIGGCVHSGGEDNWGDVSLPSTQEDIKLCSKVY